MKHILFAILLGLIFCTISSQNYQPPYEHEFKEEEINIGKEFNFIIVSLGCNCITAHHMREFNIRPFALPFDWTLTPYQALYHFIKNEFKDYFKKENLIPSSQPYFPHYLQTFVNKLGYTEMTESPLWVLDKESGMVFIHDFSNNNPATIEIYHEFQHNKYMRRIKRLYDEVNSGKYVYFIRYLDLTKGQALELYQLLKYKFPTTDFTLIVIGDNASEFNNDWHIPHIKNFFVHNFCWQKLYSGIIHDTLKE